MVLIQFRVHRVFVYIIVTQLENIIEKGCRFWGEGLEFGDDYNNDDADDDDVNDNCVLDSNVFTGGEIKSDSHFTNWMVTVEDYFCFGYLCFKVSCLCNKYCVWLFRRLVFGGGSGLDRLAVVSGWEILFRYEMRFSGTFCGDIK